MPEHSRPYAAEDLEDLIAFLARVRPPRWLADYPSPLDLREILALPANRLRARLWLDARSALVGYGIVDHFDNVLFEAAPEAEIDARYALILDWAEATVHSERDRAAPIALDATCRSEDDRRLAALLAKGFLPTGQATVTLVRDLCGTLPLAAPPPGWAIRAVRGEAEAGALVALHRAAFGTERLTLEERLSWMRAPHYAPALDLVLETAEGDLAGTCMCGIERESNAVTGQQRGYTDPIAVHPAHRRRGGARSLLAHGLRLLQQQGMTEAVMNTSSENTPLLRAAASLGYVAESQRGWYSKSIA